MIRRSLFNYIVGACEDIWRDFQAECLGGLKIYDQLETRGLLDWKVAMACTRFRRHALKLTQPAFRTP
jgi:hypothetical protein